MFTVQLLSLVVQVLLGQMLDVQQTLHDIVHRAIDEGQSQVAQRAVGEALLEGAEQGEAKPKQRHNGDARYVVSTLIEAFPVTICYAC